MNTHSIKKYAPTARRDFISAVGKRLNQLGVGFKNKTLNITEPVISGSVMQIDGHRFDALLAPARRRLVLRAEQLGFEQLVEQVAYTWFNRLCALRFMELKPHYLEHGLRVLSHPSKANGFEILDHAEAVADSLGLDRAQVVALKLAGNQDEALYRQLLLGQCHQLHQAMPFLFEALDDETELLLPDHLTRTDSILRGLVDEIPEEDWQDVEVIGWLYQFYISEKKDQVIGKVVKSEDIPAATQLFTPNWIVKYLVQNSLGRHWLMSYPDSGLKAQMDYYLSPAEQVPSVEADLAALTPTTLEPEAIKIMDPACGSGHILVETYDLLKAIYEERGYRSRDIPQLILENNLFGLDIDDRAVQLAGFALMMKAREDDRRIFTRDIQLHVRALQSTQGLELPELWRKLDLNKVAKRGVTNSLFDETEPHLVDLVDRAEFNALQSVLTLFEHAKTFGSLIEVPAEQAVTLQRLIGQLHSLLAQGDSFQKPAAQVLLPFVQQAWLLAQKYDAVIANPPYMGSKGMNAELKVFAQKHFPDSKSDLFAMFMERCFGLLTEHGYNAQVTMQSWMFLSSYQALREKLLKEHTLSCMVHMGNGVMGIAFGTAATIFKNLHINDYAGSFSYCENNDLNDTGVPAHFPVRNERLKTAKPDDFKKIPGSPVAYWVSDNFRNIYDNSELLSQIAHSLQGMITGDNNKFLRMWHELCFNKLSLDKNDISQIDKENQCWIPYNKGGDLKKWYGNNEYVLNWTNEGKDLTRSRTQNIQFYLKPCVTWTFISSSFFAARYCQKGFLWDVAGSSAFPRNEKNFSIILGLMCSKVGKEILNASNPTVNFQVENILALPIHNSLYLKSKNIVKIYHTSIEISKADWNNYEISWDFTHNPLIRQHRSCHLASTLHSQEGLTVRPDWIDTSENLFIEGDCDNRVYVGAALASTIEAKAAPTGFKLNFLEDCEDVDVGLRDKSAHPTYASHRLDQCFFEWQRQNRATIDEMQRLEQENNRLFIDAYGLQDELSPDVPLEQITLTINPQYRYGGQLSDEQLAHRFQSDTLAELISYAIGCMMGRFSLDEPGLIYAHAGNLDFDPARYQTFTADDDGIIPLTDQDWFKDDATHRLRDFVRTVWGDDTLEANLNFIADSLVLYALTPKRGENSLETIRRYLSSQFYKDHLKTYKKRPIYWLFSSGKQKAFECLVYLHRYNDSTLARMRTGYVNPLLGKYTAFADQLSEQLASASSSEAARLKKVLLALEKKQSELRSFDDKLKHYADRRIKLDLDEGVKVNYGKFGDLLAEVKAVTGGSGD